MYFGPPALVELEIILSFFLFFLFLKFKIETPNINTQHQLKKSHPCPRACARLLLGFTRYAGVPAAGTVPNLIDSSSKKLHSA